MTTLLLILGCATSAADSGHTGSETADTGSAETGEVDTAPTDNDGDGWMTPEDCDDGDAEVYPGAFDSWRAEDGDADCNGEDGPFQFDLGYDGETAMVGLASGGDVDGDGLPELATHTFNAVVEVYSFLRMSTSVSATFVLGAAGSARGVGDLDGDSLGEVVTYCEYANFDLCVFDGARLMDDFNLIDGGDRHVVSSEAILTFPLSGTTHPMNLLGDVDGDGSPELQVGEYLVPTATLLDAALVVADAPWRFPELPYAQYPNLTAGHLRSGDVDGDGLADVLANDVLFIGATLGAGGTFSWADGIGVSGLRGFVGDVSGDGRDDVWAYQPAGAGAVLLVSDPLEDGATPAPFATIIGSATTGMPEGAGGLGDADGDGYADVGVAANPPDTDDDEARLFRGSRVAGTVDIDDADRRVGFPAQFFEHIDLDGDAIDEVVLTHNPVWKVPYGGVLGGTLFP